MWLQNFPATGEALDNGTSNSLGSSILGSRGRIIVIVIGVLDFTLLNDREATHYNFFHDYGLTYTFLCSPQLCRAATSFSRVQIFQEVITSLR